MDDTLDVSYSWNFGCSMMRHTWVVTPLRRVIWYFSVSCRTFSGSNRPVVQTWPMPDATAVTQHECRPEMWNSGLAASDSIGGFGGASGSAGKRKASRAPRMNAHVR